MQLYGSVIFGITIVIAGKLGDRMGRYKFLILVTIVIGVFSFALEPLTTNGLGMIYVFVTIGMFLMGQTYGVIGATLAQPFPANVR